MSGFPLNGRRSSTSSMSDHCIVLNSTGVQIYKYKYKYKYLYKLKIQTQPLIQIQIEWQAHHPQARPLYCVQVHCKCKVLDIVQWTNMLYKVLHFCTFGYPLPSSQYYYAINLSKILCKMKVKRVWASNNGQCSAFRKMMTAC